MGELAGYCMSKKKSSAHKAPEWPTLIRASGASASMLPVHQMSTSLQAAPIYWRDPTPLPIACRKHMLALIDAYMAACLLTPKDAAPPVLPSPRCLALPKIGTRGALARRHP